MCTAATYKTKDFYFGRTLDNGFSYGEKVLFTPRNYPLHFRAKGTIAEHYAMIGMACAIEDYPLYYEAVNEKGLCMAGLNFVGNAVAREEEEEKDNIAQFELIPWMLSQCLDVKEARSLLKKINLWDVPYSESLPLAQLHWMIADKEESITVEFVEEGLRVYDNPVGVLANNPPFDKQMAALHNYMHLSAKAPENKFAAGLDLVPYSLGMGAIGLPGDLSSQSRFVRAAFVKMNSCSGESEAESVSQFFHILNAVDQQRGCCELEDGGYETTIYTCCCNADQGIYYYTCYDNHQITGVDMHREDMNGGELIWYPLIQEEQIRWQN
ncbi:MAG: choloylglycine hydrolase [Lachnospiraceae bacterium]|nr:choloylglycine hydrolase [Lachnospiraceae bacterium]